MPDDNELVGAKIDFYQSLSRLLDEVHDELCADTLRLTVYVVDKSER